MEYICKLFEDHILFIQKIPYKIVWEVHVFLLPILVHLLPIFHAKNCILEFRYFNCFCKFYVLYIINIVWNILEQFVSCCFTGILFLVKCGIIFFFILLPEFVSRSFPSSFWSCFMCFCFVFIFLVEKIFSLFSFLWLRFSFRIVNFIKKFLVLTYFVFIRV